jgi:transcriptional regulator with XRE-family HTH domain
MMRVSASSSSPDSVDRLIQEVATLSQSQTVLDVARSLIWPPELSRKATSQWLRNGKPREDVVLKDVLSSLNPAANPDDRGRRLVEIASEEPSDRAALEARDRARRGLSRRERGALDIAEARRPHRLPAHVAKELHRLAERAGVRLDAAEEGARAESRNIEVLFNEEQRTGILGVDKRPFARLQQIRRNDAERIPGVENRIALACGRATEIARTRHGIDLGAVLALPKLKGAPKKEDPRRALPLIAVELVTADGFTQREAAEALGMTQRAVSNAVARHSREKVLSRPLD